jgi:predicted Fe-Mo cluster-binding NifX family protein
MLIAISSHNNNGLHSQVSEHFGHCAYFTVVEIEANQIKSVKAINNPYAEHHIPGQIPEFIHSQGVKVMLSGGMGQRAIMFFEQYGIDVATGATGTVEQTLQAYLAGQLHGASPCADSQLHHPLN